MKKVQVIVRLKNGVLDPQGKTVAHALQALDFDEVHDVRVGKLIELEVDETASVPVGERVQRMCEKLLANPVIEDFEIVGA